MEKPGSCHLLRLLYFQSLTIIIERKGGCNNLDYTYDEVMDLLEVDKSITMPLLRGLDPLCGPAGMYKEVSGPVMAEPEHLGGQLNAHGWLEDDKGRFILDMHTKVKEGQALESKVKFEIIDK